MMIAAKLKNYEVQPRIGYLIDEGLVDRSRRRIVAFTASMFGACLRHTELR